MPLDTDVSNLDDTELLVLQHHYAEVMSDVGLLLKYATIKGVSLAQMYVGCKEAVLILGREMERRKTARVTVAERKEMA